MTISTANFLLFYFTNLICNSLIILALSWATELYLDLEYQLSVSCKCYEAANELLRSCERKVNVVEQHTQVLKRLGNSRNEVGVFYMNQSAAIQTEGTGKDIFN